MLTDQSAQRTAGGPAAASRPRLPGLLAALLVAGFAASGLRPLQDADLWWHLRAGTDLLAGAPLVETVTTADGQRLTWIKHQWAAEVVLAAARGAGGLVAVRALHVAVLGLVAAAVVTVARRNGSPVAATTASVLTLASVVPFAAQRPQLVSFALLPWFADRLLRSVERQRPDWWLPAIVGVWSWFHGLWTAAVLLYAAVLVAALLGGVLRRGVRWRFVAVGLATVAAPALSPLGPRAYQAPLLVARISGFVTEWSRPNPWELPWVLLSWGLVGAVLLVTGLRPLRPVNLAVALVAVYFAGSYLRGTTVAALLVLPLAARALSRLAAGDAPVGWGGRPAAGAVAIPVAVSLAAAGWLPAAAATHRPVIRELTARSPAAVVWTTDRLGSRLLWFAPGTVPTMDGRLDMYGAATIRRYLATVNARPGWRRELRRSKATYAWLPTGLPLTKRLRAAGDWRVVTRDATTVLFAARPPLPRPADP